MTKLTVPSIITEIPGPKTQDILDSYKNYIFYNHPSPMPLVWESAEGSVITDVDGNRFIDFSSGVLVMNAGHSHPKINKILIEQIEKLVHSYFAPTSSLLSGLKALASLLPTTHQKILPVTTGTEALEAAVKIARAFTGKNEILSFFGGFHGRSYLAMAMGGLMGVKKGYGPMPAGHVHAPYPYCYRCPFGQVHDKCNFTCLNFLEEVVRTVSSDDFAALVIEPYQGSSGVVVPPKEFIEGLRSFCDNHQMLLIYDEIQSSFCRTGKNFAFEHFSYVPDIICVGKGIANGLPTSAVIVRNDISQALGSLSWTSTFSANPISWASVYGSIEVMKEEKLAERAANLGELVFERLDQMKNRYSLIGEARGMGLSIGVEMVKDQETKEPAKEEALEIFKICTQSGLVLIPPLGYFSNVFRICPPLTIPEELLDYGLLIFEEAIKKVCKSS